MEDGRSSGVLLSAVAVVATVVGITAFGGTGMA